jgi:hypothetical protein
VSVIYLEVGQAESTSAASENRHGSASLASTGCNHVAVSRHSVVNHAQIALDSGAGGVVDVERSSRGELVELDTTGARHGEVRGLKVRLLGEEEDEAALLASVARGDVKVEDGAVAGAQVGKVLGTVRGARHILVDGDDGVRGLVGTGQGGRATLTIAVSIAISARSTAGRGGRHGSGRSRGWRHRSRRHGCRRSHRSGRSHGCRRSHGSRGHASTTGRAVSRAASDDDSCGLVDGHGGVACRRSRACGHGSRRSHGGGRGHGGGRSRRSRRSHRGRRSR